MTLGDSRLQLKLLIELFLASNHQLTELLEILN